MVLSPSLVNLWGSQSRGKGLVYSTEETQQRIGKDIKEMGEHFSQGLLTPVCLHHLPSPIRPEKEGDSLSWSQLSQGLVKASTKGTQEFLELQLFGLRGVKHLPTAQSHSTSCPTGVGVRGPCRHTPPSAGLQLGSLPALQRSASKRFLPGPKLGVPGGASPGLLWLRTLPAQVI